MDSELALNEKHICTTCPHCGIENAAGSQICQYCGTYLRNICTGVTPGQYRDLILNSPDRWAINDDWIAQFGILSSFKNIIPGNLIAQNVSKESIADPFDHTEYPHDSLHLLNGYSRFCDQCGCISSFYLQGLLPNVSMKTSNNPFEIN